MLPFLKEDVVPSSLWLSTSIPVDRDVSEWPQLPESRFSRDESFLKKQDMYLPFISGLYKQSIVLGYTVPQVVKASSYLWGSCLSGSVGGFFFGRCSGCIMMLWECSEVTQGILDEEEALGEILEPKLRSWVDLGNGRDPNLIWEC